jgi:mannose-6-phosphate isomerase-like protein (cupin superfamily)
VNLLSGEGLTYDETPYGRVAVVASLPGFRVAWIYKDQEPIDPSLDVKDVDDLIVMLQGGLKLELRGDDTQDIVLGPGDAFVIPAGVPFRGYRYPREQAEPTIFLGIYPIKEDSA